MPPDVTQASKFLFHSDFPTDKLVVLGTLDFTVTAFTNGTVNVPHGFPFIPLPWGSWATDANFTTIYGLNSGPISSTFLFSPFDALLRIHADATNLIFEAENYTGSTIHFYVRCFAFEPTTADADVDGTSPVGDGFQFNTDYNYTKLYLADYIDEAAGSGPPTTRNIPHVFGRDTQLLAWKESSGVVIPLTYHDAGDFQAEDVSVSIDASNIAIAFSGFQPALRVHYRSYIDE
ncbi:hypothetical protein [Mycobacteroides abscessus]|uniref:hypothetical protein n=1 Tax=Mycobacteroides abscessus TaxID=36809 RepID=UPI00092C1047|nr:hypothetical protein [Mycobacteroides abscessus]SIC60119.1 Uncharacterised protein [Mycobacteroides abscessus subsp. abscessus]